MGHSQQQSCEEERPSTCRRLNNFQITSVNSLVCFYTNADNLLNKKSELSSLTALYSPHIVFITEFAPKTTSYTVEEAELQMEGFNLWANLQNYKRGVLIYTARDLRATLFESPWMYLQISKQ